jgi:hypothetical protein
MQPTPGYVYAMRAKHGGIKIGSSVDVARRQIELNRNRDIELTILATASTLYCERAEKAAQAILKRHRIAGEWFSCSDELAVAAVHSVGALQ